MNLFAKTVILLFVLFLTFLELVYSADVIKKSQGLYQDGLTMGLNRTLEGVKFSMDQMRLLNGN